MTLLALVAQGALAAPVEITVLDPKVTELIFTCPDGERRAAVTAGKASLPDRVGSCAVSMVRTGGSINGPGTYTCSLDECTLQQVEHKPVSNAPGRVNVIITSSYSAQGLEVNCTDGFRVRGSIELNTTVFDGVPEGQECTLLFKGGGPPAKFRPVHPGKTYYCSITGATAVCKE